MPSEWAMSSTKPLILAIAAELDAARAQGRREGLEEAAKIAEIGRKDSLAKIVGEVIAQDIRAAINQEPTA